MGDKIKILNFLQEQVKLADFRARGYVLDSNNQPRPQRNILVKLEKYQNDFLAMRGGIRWVTLTGLRGAGKTTALFQLFSKIPANYYKLVLSLDVTSQLLGATLHEVLSVYEELIGMSFEMLDKPLFVYVDEVQYDETWGVALKSLYDRSDKVFIFVTGSAAILLNLNTDVARRSAYEKMYPLSFPEYLKISQKKYETKGLSSDVRNAIFSSESGKECFERLQAIEAKANTYYSGVLRPDFNKYIWYGSLPYMVNIDNDSIVYDQIGKTLDRIIRSDLPMTAKFSADILAKVPGILYAVADMDAFNISTLSQRFSISRAKMTEIFDALEQTELLHRIYPQGSHLNQATQKPSKYLFSSPAFRAMYYKTMGNSIPEEIASGKLNEDLVGMYLYRFISRKGQGSITYDSSAGGADFILNLGNKAVVLEVGVGSKGYRQVMHTGEKIKNRFKYGIIVSNDGLEFSHEHNIVKVPLRLFLLS